MSSENELLPTIKLFTDPWLWDWEPKVKFQFPSFDGTYIAGWAQEAEAFFEYYETAEVEQARIAVQHLVGAARKWYDSKFRDQTFYSWNSLFDEIWEEYGYEVSGEDLSDEALKEENIAQLWESESPPKHLPEEPKSLDPICPISLDLGSDRELEQLLAEVGNELLNPPWLVDELLTLLDRVYECLSKVEQSPVISMQGALSALQDALIAERLLNHQDEDVRVAVAASISEVIRITAPDAPYDDEMMVVVFQVIVSSFENLSDMTKRSYAMRTTILELVAKTRCGLVMLDIEGEALIIEMFRHFLKEIREYHPESIFSFMETIMILIIEESDDISSELLTIVLDHAIEDTGKVLPISCKLAERVIQSCATKLKSYLIETVKSLRLSLDNYCEVVSSICQGTISIKVHNDINFSNREKVKLAEVASLEKVEVPNEGSPKLVVTIGVAKSGEHQILVDYDSSEKQEDGGPSKRTKEKKLLDYDESDRSKEEIVPTLKLVEPSVSALMPTGMNSKSTGARWTGAYNFQSNKEFFFFSHGLLKSKELQDQQIIVGKLIFDVTVLGYKDDILRDACMVGEPTVVLSVPQSGNKVTPELLKRIESKEITRDKVLEIKCLISKIFVWEPGGIFIMEENKDEGVFVLGNTLRKKIDASKSNDKTPRLLDVFHGKVCTRVSGFRCLRSLFNISFEESLGHEGIQPERKITERRWDWCGLSHQYKQCIVKSLPFRSTNKLEATCFTPKARSSGAGKFYLDLMSTLGLVDSYVSAHMTAREEPNKLVGEGGYIIKDTPSTGLHLINFIENYGMKVFVRERLLGSRHDFGSGLQIPIGNGQHPTSAAEDVKILKQWSHTLCEQLEGLGERLVKDTPLVIQCFDSRVYLWDPGGRNTEAKQNEKERPTALQGIFLKTLNGKPYLIEWKALSIPENSSRSYRMILIIYSSGASSHLEDKVELRGGSNVKIIIKLTHVTKPKARPGVEISLSAKLWMGLLLHCVKYKGSIGTSIIKVVAEKSVWGDS